MRATRRAIPMRVLAGFVLGSVCLACGAKPSARFEWEAKGGAGQTMGYVGSVAAAPDGKVWVADASGRFFIFDPNGAFIEIWGEAGTGPGQFKFVADSRTGTIPRKHDVDAGQLFLPDGSFYVMDTGNNRIQRFSADRRFLRAWASGLGKPETPTGMALRGQGELGVIFRGLPGLQRFSLDGDFIGSVDLGLDQLTSSLAIDRDGLIYVAAKFPPQDGVPPRGRLMVFEPDGKLRGSFGTSEQGFVGLSFGFFLALDGEGRCIAADEWNQRIIVFGRDGKPQFFWGGSGAMPGKFDHPKGVVTGPSGAVFVADTLNKRIQKFTLAGL